MKHLLLTVTALVGLATAAPARADWFGCDSCCSTCVAWCDKVCTIYKTQVCERDVPCTINRVCHRVEVCPHQYTVMVPVWTNQKRCCTVQVKVPRCVECDVVTCCTVPVQCCDPCTGCCYTVCKEVPCVQKVQRTVWECVPVQKEYMVKVCSYVPKVCTYETRKVVCELKPETIIKKERYCVLVPCQVHVKVPVLVSCCSFCCY